MRKVTGLIIFILLLFTYLYFSNPEIVVVKKDSKIEGFVNNLRAMVQRDIFWKHQLLLAKKKYSANLAPQESMFSEFREIDQEIRKSKKTANESLKEFVSPEQYKAILLRDEADRIEELGEYRQIDDMNEIERLQNLEECRLVLPIIEAKLKEIN